MFLKSSIIKHERSMDVCYEILNAFIGSENFKLKVRVINMGFNQSYYIFNRHIYIEIKKDNIGDWFFLVDKDDTCYRYSRWKQITTNKEIL
jgi:hypothetical protein